MQQMKLYYTARQCSPLRRKFMERSIINRALSLLMKHLVIGQCQKAPNFSVFRWAPHGSLVSIGQHFVTLRIVHLPKRTETSLITKRTEADLITELDQAVHGCNSWLCIINELQKIQVMVSYRSFYSVGLPKMYYRTSLKSMCFWSTSKLP